MDRDRLAALYERFGPVVFRRARAILRDEQDARDAMQDVFTAALSASLPEDDTGALRWFYRATTNRCLSVLRRQRVRRRALPELPAPSAGRGEAGEVDRQTAAALLARFDRRTQEIVVYYVLDGMSMEEVAVQTGLSRKTVGKRLERFRRDARKILAR